jgi:hypothetical protein
MEAVMSQLAAWRVADGRPIDGPLKRELKKLGLLGEFLKETPHTWITVSLPKDADIQDVHKNISRMSHTWFDQAQAVIEGFGEQDNPHFHLLTLGRPKMSNIIRCFTKRFGVKPEKVDVTAHDSQSLYVTRRTKYLHGIKDESKMHKVEEDRAYRSANAIPHLINLFS